MSRSVAPSTGRACDVALVCQVCKQARTSIYAVRSRRQRPRPAPPKRGPKTALTKPTISSTAWLGEDYRKVWVQLRGQGVRVCQRRLLRLMRGANLLSVSSTFRLTVAHDHDDRITTDWPDEIWGTDQTGTQTAEGHACILIAVDHCTAECLGIHAIRRRDSFEALEPIRQGARKVFDSYDAKVAVGLKLMHYQAELDFLGIESSPAFVRQPEGNGISERFIRTPKEQVLRVHSFATIEELRLTLLEFMEKYNQQWLIGKHGYRTPAKVRADFEAEVAT